MSCTIVFTKPTSQFSCLSLRKKEDPLIRLREILFPSHPICSVVLYAVRCVSLSLLGHTTCNLMPWFAVPFARKSRRKWTSKSLSNSTYKWAKHFKIGALSCIFLASQRELIFIPRLYREMSNTQQHLVVKTASSSQKEMLCSICRAALAFLFS